MNLSRRSVVLSESSCDAVRQRNVADVSGSGTFKTASKLNFPKLRNPTPGDYCTP